MMTEENLTPLDQQQAALIVIAARALPTAERELSVGMLHELAALGEQITASARALMPAVQS